MKLKFKLICGCTEEIVAVNSGTNSYKHFDMILAMFSHRWLNHVVLVTVGLLSDEFEAFWKTV